MIVAGLAGEERLAARITEAGLALPERAESLAVRHIVDSDRHTVVLCGADAAGLMYAALDTARRAAGTQHRGG